MMDLHTHSTFSDGAHSPEEMVQEAIAKGLRQYGISDHSHADWDEVCMPTENIPAYHQELRRLKEAYAGQIEIKCGLERDYYSDDFSEYDYVIGSVHAMRMPDGYYLCVDWMPERMERDCETYFGGDWYALTEAFFQLEADVVRRTKCDIIGHFDLVSKFNEQRRWFDPAHPRYRAAWQGAAETLLRTGKTFEVNTGAISRGYRTDAYPAKEIRTYLKEKGAKLILSSDAHQKENICFQFDRFAAEI
ncbi:MAG: histidinol-phosphatase [Clostridia bacterium]|nr:histidinol-phosphatase [Clostridia bacterium]